MLGVRISSRLFFKKTKICEGLELEGPVLKKWPKWALCGERRQNIAEHSWRRRSLSREAVIWVLGL